MRAAIYVRVSTEEQAAEGYSLDSQKEILTDHCLAEGWEVAAVYEDDGYSGRNERRPAYRRMMDEAEMWDLILVVKMDRIHRNSRNFMNMMDRLQRAGKMFVSSSESLDTTNALGRFVVDMIQRLAQLESEQIGERTHMGMREKAETLSPRSVGRRTMGFTPPFGYRLEDGALISDVAEIDTARRIFFEYLNGGTLDSIAYSLNRDGIFTRKGNPWNRRNLSTVVHNPVYAGFMRWEELLIPHDAETVVSATEFNAVQRMMATRVRDPARRIPTFIPSESDSVRRFRHRYLLFSSFHNPGATSIRLL